MVTVLRPLEVQEACMPFQTQHECSHCFITDLCQIWIDAIHLNKCHNIYNGMCCFFCFRVVVWLLFALYQTHLCCSWLYWIAWYAELLKTHKIDTIFNVANSICFTASPMHLLAFFFISGFTKIFYHSPWLIGGSLKKKKFKISTILTMRFAWDKKVK